MKLSNSDICHHFNSFLIWLLTYVDWLYIFAALYVFLAKINKKVSIYCILCKAAFYVLLLNLIHKYFMGARLKLLGARLELSDARLELLGTRLELSDARLKLFGTRLELSDDRLKFIIK